ncbi:MAG: hypothetical protein EBR89_07795, partial [Betaproteobacteria bacterium]|nr:hypothetical protein [Betaproteobacteria bacterium]
MAELFASPPSAGGTGVHRLAYRARSADRRSVVCQPAGGARDPHPQPGNPISKTSAPASLSPAPVRIDKWLWAARLYKTRSLASEEVSLGRVQVNGQDVKPAREMRVGDRLTLRQGRVQRELIVKGLSHQRGPATVAQLLYEETPESIRMRAELAERMRLAPEPATAIEHGRPTKRERRDLQKG